MSMTSKTLTIGTRTSQLALWQTNTIGRMLEEAWPEVTCRLEPYVTQGDKTLDKPLPDIGGKGLFTLELENALRDGRIDLAVHSLKDLPIEDAPGLTVGAIVGRADPRDVLICRDDYTLGNLPPGAVVGTSSLRRQAQLLAARPDLTVRSIRGNVETRIRKVHEGDYDAAVLAAAGVTRLGLEEHVSQWLPAQVMLSAPGQGALAVQCRADDEATLKILQAIDNINVRACVTAERSFLYHLSGGCSTPVAALATGAETALSLSGLVAAPDGSRLIVVEGSGAEAWALGRQLADEALAQGARELLADV